MDTDITPGLKLTPIAVIRSCFKEKFGIPRQPNLVPEAPATLVFEPEFARPEAIRGLAGFSHIWIIFLFHQAPAGSWRTMVRPPRLGGNKKVGIFASRSPFRPNPVGMSAVALESIEQTPKGPVLHLKGGDFLDQTPVLDIKPYLPYADSIPDAAPGFAPEAPAPGLEIRFCETAREQCLEIERKIPRFTAIVTQVLENDPRPAYTADRGEEVEQEFGFCLFDRNIKWRQKGRTATVTQIT